MNTKMLEGIIGAGANMKMMDTPMRIYRAEASKGDKANTATMERALGYANQFADKAEAYQDKASQGIEEESEEMRAKAKLERELAAQGEGTKNPSVQTEAGEEAAAVVELSEEALAALAANGSQPVEMAKVQAAAPMGNGSISVQV